MNTDGMLLAAPPARATNGSRSATRADALTFYALASVSFLESAVATYVDNMRPIFREDEAITSWLANTWLPEEAGHGRVTRAYVETLWPEFEWESAYQSFLICYTPRCDSSQLRPSPALEALARCVTETEAAMMYRCLAAYVADPHLQQLLQQLSRDEVRHYRYFRDAFDRYDHIEQNPVWTKAAVVLRRSELVRDEDLALAFHALNACWQCHAPFAPMNYPQYLAAGARVMQHHFPFEDAKRMLLRPLRSGNWREDVLIDGLGLAVSRQFVQMA